MSTEIIPETVLIGRLKRRAEFVSAAKGRRWHGKALTLQSVAASPSEEVAAARVGFTLTRKVGCAVVRNRARRRLREAVRLGTALAWQPGHDYVILGRVDAIRVPFEEITHELERALQGVHGSRSKASRTARPERTRPGS